VPDYSPIKHKTPAIETFFASTTFVYRALFQNRLLQQVFVPNAAVIGHKTGWLGLL